MSLLIFVNFGEFYRCQSRSYRSFFGKYCIDEMVIKPICVKIFQDITLWIWSGWNLRFSSNNQFLH